ncbi:MAG: TIGR01212 family radical SAM protein [Lachnospiraceae bacterium]|nr:TIGR01212 family radical SAM protein [Lachnospiraceae bacterium]
MQTLNDYLKNKYGYKVYKISLDAGMSCPNRDGKVSFGGCSFCNAGGSGDFCGREKDLDLQIEDAKALVERKLKGTAERKYIAYFQAFTNTYASVERLREIFSKVIKREDILGLSIGTRPDCIPEDVLELLCELNSIKPVWVELGLQTIHEKTAKDMNRGYALPVFEDTYKRLKAAGIKTVVHLILFYPGESREDMLASVKYVGNLHPFGVKLHLLQVLKGTEIARRYEEEKFYLPTLDEYAEFLKEALKLIPEDTVLHRITGDGPKSLLTAPLWCGDKKRVMNKLKKELVIY